MKFTFQVISSESQVVSKWDLSNIHVCHTANISNMLLIQFWRLETISRVFYDFKYKAVYEIC